MNIVELVDKYRFETKDTSGAIGGDGSDLFLSNDIVVDLFNEAEQEACRRKRLIFDKSTDGVCLIDITSGVDTGSIDGSINEIDKAYLVNDSDEFTYLSIVNRDNLDDLNPDWRESTEEPEYLIVDNSTFQIVPPPTEDCTLHLEVYRGPISEMFYPVDPVPTPAPDPLIESPEISSSHHRHLYHWVLYRAFNMPDADFYDPKLADLHNSKFIAYFGIPIDANRQKNIRKDIPHRNKVWL